jgi:hypothetical protein
VGDVRLGVELVLSIDAAFDLLRADGLDDRRNAFEERILGLLAFKALIEASLNPAQRFLKRLLRSSSDLVAHEDADVIDLLPLAFESQ